MEYVKIVFMKHMPFLVHYKHSKSNFSGIDILTPFEKKTT